VRERQPSGDGDHLDDPLLDPAVCPAVADVPGWDVLPLQGPQLNVQAAVERLGRTLADQDWSRHALVGDGKRPAGPGGLWLSMFWQSTKAADLLRDPRILVHSVITGRGGGEGEFKIRGTAQAEPDPDL